MNTRNLITSLTVALAMMAMTLGADQPATTRPAASAPAAEGKPVTATVVAVSGLAQYRATEDQKWADAKVGQVVDIGGEFRTGPHGSVSFKLPPDQVITLDRLGTIKLLAAIQNNATHVTTDLGMKYGRVQYDVEAGDQVEHQTTVRAPSATLSMRGSETFTFFDQRPGPATVSGRNTSITFKPVGSPIFITFGRKGDNARQTVGEGATGAAGYREHHRIVDPGDRNARSDAEFNLLGNYELYSGVDNTSNGITAFQGKSNAKTQVPTAQPSGGCPCGGGGGE